MLGRNSLYRLVSNTVLNGALDTLSGQVSALGGATLLVDGVVVFHWLGEKRASWGSEWYGHE